MLLWNTSIVTLFAVSLFSLANVQVACAQYPIITSVPSSFPAVVSYVSERRGLFGRRVVYRPIVTPVARAVPAVTSYPVAVSRPVVVAPPVAVATPLVVRYPPPTPRVSRYYTPMPPAPVLVPLRPYQIPVTTYYVPVVGY